MSSLRKLEDLDRCIEEYFSHKVPGMPEGRLPPTVRGKDNEQAWDARLDLLSPRALFESKRRENCRKELTQKVCEAVGDKRKGIMNLDELTKVDRDSLPPETAKSLEQIDPKAIIKDPEGRRVSFKHMVAWKIEPHMLDPNYFMRRSFPSCVSETAKSKPTVRDQTKKVGISKKSEKKSSKR